MVQLKRTSLFMEYSEMGAKTIDFGGWELPVQFSGIMDEHICTRERIALFDVSHMGEIVISGKESLPFLQNMITNDVSTLKPSKIQYGFMCNEKGGTVDDFLVYMLAEDHYMLVVNASNIEKDLTWLRKHANSFHDVRIQDKSPELSLLALQGPKSVTVLERITSNNIKELKFFTCKQDVHIKGIDAHALISRTGYTGEDGFEIYIDNEKAPDLWNLLLHEGESEGILPAGLGARDTLRLEAGLPLYGQELTEIVSPIEAGLSFAVKLNKKSSFIGKEALHKQMINGTKRKVVGLEMIDKGILRPKYTVYSTTQQEIGTITSGTHSPTLQNSIGMALIDQKYSDIGTTVIVQIRKRKLKAKIVETPFYRRTN